MAAESPRHDEATLEIGQLPERTIFFDGVCNFCDHTVQWLLDHDPAGVFHYASLQGETAERLRVQLPGFPDDRDSIVYLDTSGPTPVLLRRFPAIFAILGQLDSWVRHWTFLRHLPDWLLGLAYRAFAASRYRVFGKLETCRVPDASVRALFLP